MRLYFLRHGPAEAREAWRGDDRERPLSQEGRRALHEAGPALAGLDLGVDLIVTSPLTRARETADIVAAGLGIAARVVEDERLAPGFGPSEAKAIVAEHGRDATVMLVGHEPGFSRTLAALTGGSSLVIKKGGLARVDALDATLTAAELVWLLPPKALHLVRTPHSPKAQEA
jgi:phosphohistidine phosphatase